MRSLHLGIASLVTVKFAVGSLAPSADPAVLNDAARIMERKKVRRLPVIDGEEALVGMLSLGDVY